MNLNRLLTSSAVALAFLCAPAFADYPEKDIMLSTQSGAGAQTDIGIRTALPFIQSCLGSGATIVVQNRPGSNGDVNNTFIATSEPDGYTMGVVNVPGMVSNPIANKREYSFESYDYLGALTGGMVMISVREDAPWKTLTELIAHIKESGQPLTVSSGGKGSSEHLALLQLEQMVPDFKFNLIPFNDSAAAINGLLGGHVQATAASGVEGMQDQVNTLAIALPERLPELPDVPTFKEQGIDLVGGSNHIYVVPKGTPADVTAKLRTCVEGVADNPEYQALAEQRKLQDLRMTGAEAETMVREKDKLLRDIWAATPWIDK